MLISYPILVVVIVLDDSLSEANSVDMWEIIFKGFPDRLLKSG
jgi:hypothetical protein